VKTFTKKYYGGMIDLWWKKLRNIKNI
jgi:hypothetical protein